MSFRFTPISLDVGITGKLKYVTVLCLVMVFGLQASVNADGCSKYKQTLFILDSSLSSIHCKECLEGLD